MPKRQVKLASGEKRDAHVLMRVKVSEKLELQEGAKRDGLSLSAWLVRLGLMVARRKQRRLL